MRCCGCWTATGYFRAKKVIKSCKTMGQLNVARRYGTLTLMNIINSKYVNVGFDRFTEMKLELQELLGRQELKIGKE